MAKFFIDRPVFAWVIALFILLAFFMNTLSAQSLSAKQNLTSPFMTWVFNEEGKTEIMSCAVPGNVHRDLVLNKKIVDPLIGTDRKSVV